MIFGVSVCVRNHCDSYGLSEKHEPSSPESGELGQSGVVAETIVIHMVLATIEHHV